MGTGPVSLSESTLATSPTGRFASASDLAECKRLHRRYGTTYYFATKQLPRPLRLRVHALYGFVRTPDDWVDSMSKSSPESRRGRLRNYRSELIRAMDGVVPSLAVLRAFCDAASEASMPLDEPLRFLQAMEEDLFKTRYQTYAELSDHMRGSSVSVGLMVCHLLDIQRDSMTLHSATALWEAMQLTNILRDVSADFARGRIYLPADDMEMFHGSEDAILRQEMNPAFMRLMRFEVERARGLYAQADLGIPLLSGRIHNSVKLARILYERILDRIEERGYNVLGTRIRTSRTEKVWTSLRVLTGLS